MNTYKIRQTDLKVSRIAYGCMGIGGRWNREPITADERKAANHTGAQIRLLQKAIDQPLVVNQVELNLLHHHLIDNGVMANKNGATYAAADGTLDYCRLKGILVQAWAPVAGGILFNPPADAGEPVRRTAELVARLAQEKDTSLEAIVLAWLLRHPAGIQPIVGTTKPERVAASCLADNVELSREEWYQLFSAARGAPLS